MRALHFDGSVARVRDVPDPAPRPGWAVGRVRLAGVCSTDLEILRGYMGFRGVLGHEVVLDVVEGPPAWVGRRATSEINFACGACEACGRGLGRHCPTRTVMGILGADGAMAELVAVPAANLHAVPEGLSDEAAVFAEPLAAAHEILEQVRPAPGTRAIVLGDGKLGLLAALVLRAAGLEVRCVGRHPEKLAIAARAGVETSDAGAQLERVELVVDATGSPEGFARAASLVRPRGTLVLKSTVADESRLHLAPLVIDEITVVGSRCGPFPPALADLAARRVDPSPLVSATLPLDEGPRALALAAERGTLKVLLRP